MISHTSPAQRVLETDIKRRVRQTREGHPLLACDVLGTSVVVPHRVFNVHVDNLTISSRSTDRRRNHDEGVFVHEIPYASLILGAVARVRDEVEFKGVGEKRQDEQDQEKLDDGRVSIWRGRHGCGGVARRG